MQITSLKEQLKKVTDEKQSQARAHTEAKFNLKKEIEVLKKSLSPRAEELLADLRRSEEHKARIESDLVNSHILNDALKVYYSPGLLLLLCLMLYLMVSYEAKSKHM